MATYKNIRIKKRGGGTRLQRVQVLANGKYKFVKNLNSSSSSKKKTKKTRGKSMASKKKGNSKKRSRKISISGIATISTTLLASPAPGWGSAYDKIQAGQFDHAAQSALASLTGIKLGGIGGQTTTEIPWQKIINPFCMEVAPALKAFFWTKLVTKVIKKVAGNPLSGIPIVKDYVRFS